MKLKERLEQLDPQTIVFLGSATSFFDVNRAGYMREEKYLNDLSKQEKHRLKKLKKSAADKFEPIADREVKGELVRTAIDGATLIVVTGDGKGNYWFINEKYKSGEVPLWEDKKDEKI